MEKEKVSSGNIIDWKVLKRILQFIRPYRGRFYFLVLLTVLLGVLTPLRPLLIQYTLDAHVAAGKYWEMVNVMILILGLLVIQSLVQYVHTYISGRIGQYVIRDIRIKLYEHIVSLLSH
jgi:ATP-binding cassette subfamily B multidrug efflux pump